MTLAEVVDNARFLLNEPLDTARTFGDNSSGFWTDQNLQYFHNLAQRDVQNEMIQTFEDLFVTATALSIVAGTAEYGLPSGTIKVRRLEDYRGTRPVEIIPTTLNQRDNDGGLTIGESGTLVAGTYYLRGNQIVLTSTPTFTNASAIRLFYIQQVSDVSAGSNTSQLPGEHHNLLVWGVVRLALRMQQSDTTLADAEWERGLSKMKQQLEDRQAQRPRKVAVVSYGGIL